MPCLNPDHTHDWPEEGVLVIEKCERYCGFCEGDGANHEWKFPWFLRRHVRNTHKTEYPNLVVSDNWHVHMPLSLSFTTDFDRTTSQDNALDNSNTSTKTKTTKKPNISSSQKGSTTSTLQSGQLKKQPQQCRKRTRAELSSDTDEDVNDSHHRGTDAKETPAAEPDQIDVDADISMNDDLSQESSLVFDHGFNIRPPDSKGRHSGSSAASFRPSTTLSQPESVLVTACNSHQDNSDRTKRGLRIPIFEVDGQTQFNATTRHYDMLDLKLSWRDGLRELARQGLEAGLYCCEIGVIMADEVDRHIIKNASAGNEAIDSTDTSLSCSKSSATGPNYEVCEKHTEQSQACGSPGSPSESRRDSFTDIMSSALGPKIQNMSAKLDRLVWNGFGESFMRELFTLDGTQNTSALTAVNGMPDCGGSNQLMTGDVIDLTGDKHGDAVPGSCGEQVRWSENETATGSHVGAINPAEHNSQAVFTRQNNSDRFTSNLSGRNVDYRNEALRPMSIAVADPPEGNRHTTPALVSQHRLDMPVQMQYSRRHTGGTRISSAPAYLEPTVQSFPGWSHGMFEPTKRRSSSLQQHTPMVGTSGYANRHVHHHHCCPRRFPGAHATCCHGHTVPNASVGGANNANIRPQPQPGQYSFRPQQNVTPAQLGSAEQQRLAVEEAGKQLLAIQKNARDFGARPTSASEDISMDDTD